MNVLHVCIFYHGIFLEMIQLIPSNLTVSQNKTQQQNPALSIQSKITAHTMEKKKEQENTTKKKNQFMERYPVMRYDGIGRQVQ